jgi:prepilin-type processing-associated H-X9-DG protein
MRKLTIDDFQITSVSGKIKPQLVPGTSPLGPLAQLVGTWKGTGFNQIWRPFHGSQDRFLELNETQEVLQFVEIPGDIPNRGLLQADVNLHGATYLQKVNDVNVLNNGKPSGIHIEPGIWITVPSTTNPTDPDTVARLANIPHGTSLVAQGTAFNVAGGPVINPASITPFLINPPHTPIAFPETNLGVASAFRTPPADIPHVTQAMVNNPNLVLTAAIAGQNIVSTTVLRISTTDLNPPNSGGGTSNIAFLDGAAGGPNARSAQMDAIFWIETVQGHDPHDKFLQLQYTQTVLLNFNGLSWPHVSVATLRKQREDEDDN